jgi:outer membrane protein, heavy metal efflux system
MFALRNKSRVLALVLAASVFFSGCGLFRPAGEKAERDKANAAGKNYTEPVELPPLPEKPSQDDYLQYAFLANSDLQARYWEWRAAIEQVPQVSSLPNIAIPFSVMFNKDNMSLWDRTTLGVTNDPMTNIPFPTKLKASGRRSLERARAAGSRFQEAKFLLQAKVLTTYDDLALLGESIRIQEQNVALLTTTTKLASQRAATGLGGQEELLRAQTELDLARNQFATLKSQVPGMTAKMNALLGRPADAPVALPDELPPPRQLALADADLIQIGAEHSPELAALAREVAGQQEALGLAKKGYLPDFSLSASITGSIAQTVGGMLILPTRLAAIRGAIDESKANLKAAEAARQQYQRDLAASFVLNLYIMRNDERQAQLFAETIIPRAQQMVQIAQSGYSSGRVPFIVMLDAQRTLLDARLTLAQLQIEREKALAAIETWSAVDVAAMTAPTLNPAGGMPGPAAMPKSSGSPASGNAGGGGM